MREEKELDDRSSNAEYDGGGGSSGVGPMCSISMRIDPVRVGK